MDSRQLKGLEIAATSKLMQSDGEWLVPSQSGNGDYRVNLEEQRCTCLDHETRNIRCKHILAAEIVYQRETAPDGTVTETKTVRVTYSQDWSSYNRAQMNEERMFGDLLQSLCAGVPQPPQTRSRLSCKSSDSIW